MEIPNEFFTIQSMLTLSGATGATFVICNGIQKAFNFNPRWLALAIAQVISIWGIFQANADIDISDLFIAIVNGFLIFCTAAGGTSIGAGITDLEPKGELKARGAAEAPHPQPLHGKRSFFSRWV